MTVEEVSLYPLAGSLDVDGEAPSLPHQDSQYPDWGLWKWRRTLSYWISMLYLEGAFLFIIGSLFENLGFLAHTRKYVFALVSGPNCTGSVLFSVGSYLGVLQVINIPSTFSGRMMFFLTRRRWRALGAQVSWKSFVAYVFYTTGSCFLATNTCAGLMTLTATQTMLWVRLPGLLACCAYTSGSLLNCHNNRVWLMQYRTRVWWLCMVYLCGSLHYFLANVVLIVGASASIADYGFTVGAVSFATASLIGLWMWKSEQFGLVIPELNLRKRRDKPPTDELSMHEQYGCGRATKWQIPWMLLYVANASLAVVRAFVVYITTGPLDHLSAHEYADCAAHFLLAHGVIMLASVVHHVPTKRPHSLLLMYMRCVLAMLTVNAAVQLGMNLKDLK